MINIDEWIFPTTTIRTILKFRPRSAELFEKYEMNPWTYPEAKVGDLCRSAGVEWPMFAEELRNLPLPEADADWGRLPVSFLLDYLCGEHRKFLHTHVSAIKYAFYQ